MLARPWTDALALVALLGLTACSIMPGEVTTGHDDRDEEPTSEAHTPMPEPPPRELLERPIEDAAALLADATTAEEGVWVLLSGLGLGVYTGGGEQLLAGSETGPDDLWLLDSAIAGLARLAHGAPIGFGDLHAGLATDGLELTVEELQAVYLAALESRPDLPMARLLETLELGLDAEAEEVELRPLHAWLLLLALLPSNPTSDVQAGARWVPPLAVGQLTPRGGALLAAAADCGDISGDGSASGWSLVGDAVGIGESSARGALAEEVESRIGGRAGPALTGLRRWLSRFAKALEALTAALALDSVETQLTVDQASTRRLRDREPGGSQVVVLLAEASSRQVPPVRCGPLTGAELPGGPLEGARVRYVLDGFLEGHGHLRYPGGGTWQALDAAGTNRVRYETIHDEPPDAYRRSSAQRGSGTVTATFDSLLHALGESFNLFASAELVAGAAGMFDRSAQIEVRWHEEGVLRAFDTVVTASGDVVQVDLVACDGPRGGWFGTVQHQDFFDIPWTTEVSFAFPDEVSDASVTWTPGQGPALLDDGEPLYEFEFSWVWDYLVVFDGDAEPPRLRFHGDVTGEIVGMSSASQDASFTVPVHTAEDPRCPD